MLTGKHPEESMSNANFQIGRTIQRQRANGTFQDTLLVYTDAVEPGAVIPDPKRLDWVLKEVQAAKDLKDGDAIEMVPWAERPDA
jgi:hypothetical protein